EEARSFLHRAQLANDAVPASHLIRAGLLDLSRGVVSLVSGDFEGAIAQLGRSAEGAAATGGNWGEMLARSLRRVALHAVGRHEEAVDETARLSGGKRPSGITRLGTELADTEMALRAGDPAEIARRVPGVLAGLHDYGSYGILYLCGLPNVVERGLRDPT